MCTDSEAERHLRTCSSDRVQAWLPGLKLIDRATACDGLGEQGAVASMAAVGPPTEHCRRVPIGASLTCCTPSDQMFHNASTSSLPSVTCEVAGAAVGTLELLPAPVGQQ